MKNLILSILSLVVVFSCKKEKGNDPLPTVSNTPTIELANTSSTSINQFDDVLFRVNYVDGDGDLGETDADAKSIFVVDNRNTSIIHEFHLQPLAPIGQAFAIQGTLIVTIENVILLDQANTSENADFSIYIKDRAGNKSNTISSPSIKITK
jgi:hypothetical protein